MGQPSGKGPGIGVRSGNRPDNDGCLRGLRQGFTDLGYIEGKTHFLEVRWSEGRQEPFPSLARDLVALKVDLIVSFVTEAHPAVKQATATIPIVMATSTYPVELGLVASFARPGGNITGVAQFTSELMAKRVQILKEAAPSISRVAVIRQPGYRNDLIVRDFESAAHQLGIKLQVVEVRRAEDLPGAFQTATRGGAEAVMTTQGPFFGLYQAAIAELALKHRLPSISGEAGAPRAGTLLFYGPYVREGCERAASYADRILKGAKPSDLPVEQPRKF